MKSRIPFFCKGCPHILTYKALMQALERVDSYIINGDIGCYELAGFGNAAGGEYEPIRDLIDTLYVMGSGISIAQGQYWGGYSGKIIALAGDSTFFHACMPSLVNVAQHEVDLLYIIFDNRCTAMTGHQPNPSSYLDIGAVATALGANFVRTVNSYDTEQLVKAIGDGLAHAEASVVVSKGECVLHKKRTR